MMKRNSSSFRTWISSWGIGLGLVLITVGLAPRAEAQGSKADYDRAFSLRQRLDGKVLNRSLSVNWSANGDRLWYKRALAGGGGEYIVVDTATGRKEPLVDQDKLAAALKQAGEQDVRADRLALEQLEFSKDGHNVAFFLRGTKWLCDRTTGEVKRQADGTPPPTGKALTTVPRASTRTGSETHITFVNQTDGDVELFWLSAEGERRSYGRLAKGQRREQHTFAGHVWLAVNAKGETLAAFAGADEAVVAEITGTPQPSRGPAPPAKGKQRSRGSSPDGKWRAFIKDDNLWVANVASKEEIALSHDGSAENAYAEQFMWSPDSRWLVGVRVEPGQEHKVNVVESSPRDQVQPRLVTYDYLKPGDKLPHPRPVLFEVAAKRQVAISDTLFPNPFTESGSLPVRWEKDSQRFTFSYNQRGHQVFRVISVEAATGTASALVDEQCATFFDYSGKQFQYWAESTHELVWMSERDGWNHLYLYDTKTGRVKNQITRGEWVVRGVDNVDEKARQIWFRAGGIRPGQDPYQPHFCRVNFDGSGLVILTEGDGTHSVSYSPDRRFFVDTWSRVDAPPVHELRRCSDGKLVVELERADTSELSRAGWHAPERFTAKGRDGTTDIYGVIHRPSNFDALKKYPVIEYIYAGPQSSFVPKEFGPLHGGWVQEMAELGFIVVQCDGMGTSNRSKKFHDVCWKNLVDAGLPDRIAWIKAAAATRPYMDLSRVGIYGGSAGGQNSTAAVLTHPEFYQVAVSDCGCHDNRMDKIWWNEQWMGWPVGPHYAEQSNVTLAKNLRGKLMLVVGELDKNVDPASTMQVANALMKADKDYELLIIQGGGHGSCETPYGKRRRADYFVRNLLGVEPRHN